MNKSGFILQLLFMCAMVLACGFTNLNGMDFPYLQELRDIEVPENPETLFDQLRMYKDQLLVMGLLFFLFTLISEDTACVAAGLAVTSGITEWHIAFWGCFAGVLAGDITFFLLGYYVGNPVLQWWPLNKILSPKKLEISQKWFHNNGILVVVLSRFTPGLRGPLYISAGILKMSRLKFMSVHTISALIWTPAIIGIAFLIGYPIMGWIESWGYWSVFLVVPVILFIVYLTRYIIRLLAPDGRTKLAEKFEEMKDPGSN